MQSRDKCLLLVAVSAMLTALTSNSFADDATIWHMKAVHPPGAPLGRQGIG